MPTNVCLKILKISVSPSLPQWAWGYQIFDRLLIEPVIRSWESTHLLYTLNTFELSNPWSVSYLRPTLLPEHWDCIRAVELRWSFPGHWLPSKDPVRAVYVSAGRAQWLETCRTLERLPALQSFVLILGSSWYSEPAEKLPAFLEPLRELRVHHSRFKAKGAGCVEQELLSEGCSSDDESLSSSSLSINLKSSAGTYPQIRNSCDGSIFPASNLGAVGAPETWELRLQGQPYYLHELGCVSSDLRRRRINCCISTE